MLGADNLSNMELLACMLAVPFSSVFPFMRPDTFPWNSLTSTLEYREPSAERDIYRLLYIRVVSAIEIQLKLLVQFVRLTNQTEFRKAY